MQNNQKKTDWPKAILTNIIDAVIAMDGQGIIRYINPAARKMIHLSTSKIINKPATDILHFIDNDNRQNISIPSIKSFNNTQPIILTRAIFISSTKKQIVVNAVFTPVKSDHNIVTGIALRFRDVTKMTLHDKKLWNEQKIKAIGAMAGGIANDFINWLKIISTHATAITDLVIPRTRAYEEATSIINTAKQARGMTSRLISVSRLATNHYSQHLEAVDLNTVIKTAIKQSKISFNNDKLEFKQKHRHTNVSVLVNEAILLDCILNIFRNAIDAMPDGGVISIDITKSKDSAYNNHAVLRIRDTGSGMNKNVLSQACDPFFSTKDKSYGMGLGLTIVKTFTQNYGGDIKIQSKEGLGTSVRLFLPLNNKATNEEKHHRSNNKSTLLIVDNNQKTLEEINIALKNVGNTVHSAIDTETALKIYKEKPKSFDVVIIDLVMPKKDGKYLYNEIIKINPEASIIIMSGFSRTYVRDYMTNNKWWFAQKPINQELLIATIERILK